MTFRALVLSSVLFAPLAAYAAPTSLSVQDAGGTTRTIPAEGTLSAPTPHSVPEVGGNAVASGNPMPVVQTGTPGLPTGAATATGQVKQGITSVGVQQAGGPLAVTVGTYNINTIVGGPIKFLTALATAGGCADLNKMLIQLGTTGTGGSPSLELDIFSKPLTGTYTDNTTFARNAADVRIARLISDPFWSTDGAGGSWGTSLDSTWTICNTESTPTTTLYGLLVTRSATFTPTATTDLAGGLSIQVVAK